MKRIKEYLPWAIRIIVFALFMLSGIAKMFPIWAFEKQLVDLGLTSWCQAPYLSRFIIGFEMAIGIAILQPHFIKRIIIPSTILLLLAFCVHLSIQMYQHGAMNGNCGCFGQLIPMTPLEAFIKNIITIGLLVYLYRNVSEKERGENKFSYLLLISLASFLFMFVFFPIAPCTAKPIPTQTATVIDSIPPEVVQDTILPVDTLKKTEVKKPDEPVKVVEYAPKKTTSRFSSYSTFGTTKVNLDEGKKIVCMFAPGCDHCQETAKQICALKKTQKLPEVYIIFMDEETFKLPEFFKIAQCNFPYQVIAIPEFWTVLGSGNNTPGVFCLWNGNIVRSFEGTDKNKFDSQACVDAFKAK